MEREEVMRIYDVVFRNKFNVELKEEQISIICAIVSRRNPVGFLPTGFGKSLCYVLPPLILDEMEWDIRHTSLVISPLKSLMKDQVDHLSSLGIRAAAIQANMPQRLIQEIAELNMTIVFASPEAILTSFWKKLIMNEVWRTRVCLLAFDEAHCISEWGEDFRPDYKNVSVLRSMMETPCVALTATITEKIKKDIFTTLALHESETEIVARVPDRPNIFLQIQKSKQDEEQLKWITTYLLQSKSQARKILIYCRSINIVAEMYLQMSETLQESGVDQLSPNARIIEMFHRGLDEGSIARILSEFRKKDSHIRCLVSTVAFGLGIQIPDVYAVVHWGVPKSVLSYWQEVGRAGRDKSTKAVGICYAYARSMNSANQEIRSVFGANQGCVRKAVLDILTVKEMTKLPEKKKCESQCNKCTCDFCSCCSVCMAECQCGHADAFFHFM